MHIDTEELIEVDIEALGKIRPYIVLSNNWILCTTTSIKMQ